MASKLGAGCPGLLISATVHIWSYMGGFGDMYCIWAQGFFELLSRLRSSRDIKGSSLVVEVGVPLRLFSIVPNILVYWKH